MPSTEESGHSPWQPLGGRKKFRLIKLFPGCSEEPLECSLLTYDIEDHEVSYQALSYTWGDKLLTESILCEGIPVKITRNLHSALCRIRSKSDFILIWNDALCIDQNSPDERAEQIPLMSKIYSGAVTVIVDLGKGEGSEDDDIALALQMIMATPAEKRTDIISNPSPLAYLGLPGFLDPMWSLVLNKFFSRAWYQRIWCVQEVVLARKVTILFGSHSTTPEELTFAALLYAVSSETEARVHHRATWDTSSYGPPRMGSLSLLTTMGRRRQRLQELAQVSEGSPPSTPSLCELLKSTSLQECTDRRDRVYALYGMADPNLAHNLPVSYLEPLDDLETRLSTYLIDAGNGTWALIHSGGIRDSPSPSWTIDLETLGVDALVNPTCAETSPQGHNLIYSAGGSSEAVIHITDRSTSAPHLRVSGIFLGSVAAISPFILPDFFQQVMLGQHDAPLITGSELHGVLQSFLDIGPWYRENKPSGADSEALWRTMVGNENHHPDDPDRDANRRPSPAYGRHWSDIQLWARDMMDFDLPEDILTITAEEYEKISMSPDASKFWYATLYVDRFARSSLRYHRLSINRAYLGRKLCTTSSGSLALVPQKSVPSDVIAIFRGVPAPFVLRERDDGVLAVVGSCYVHGLMNGEAVDRASGEPVAWQEVSLC
jgi:hypothetical protein